MTLPVVYLRSAQEDVDSAYVHYEQLLAGLGEHFLASLRDKVALIEVNPELYGVFYKDIRAVPLHRFPYVVYYRIEVDRVLIIAVQHGRRSSRVWRGRI